MATIGSASSLKVGRSTTVSELQYQNLLAYTIENLEETPYSLTCDSFSVYLESLQSSELFLYKTLRYNRGMTSSRLLQNDSVH